MSTTPVTAWQRIAQDITARIASGETSVGSKIPSQQQLVRQHGASLGTIKRAVEYLQDLGILQGMQGAGIFVLRAPAESELDFPTVEGDRLRAVEDRLRAIEDRLAQLEHRTP